VTSPNSRDRLNRDPQPADNLILWLPVFLICGIGCYFLSPWKLDISWSWAGLLGAIGLAIVSFPLRQFTAWRWVVTFFIAVIIGLLLIQYRVDSIHTLLLKDRVWNAEMSGTIQGFEQSGNNWTVILQDAHLPDDNRNYIFRLSVRQNDFEPDIGGVLTVKASMMPPSPPLVPNSFDFRRHAFFDGLGGYGYTTKIISYQKPETQMKNWLEQYRDWLARKVFSTLQQPEAGIVSSLLTGQRAGIHRKVSRELQQSGLYHVISISGLHVSLMATIVFFMARLLMALSMNFALRFPIKKIAAFMALIAIIIYMLIVGSSPPTLRSVLMTGLALVAIMLDREPIQMRVVALAAVFILVLQPESAIDVGFQMSFCAVIGLVAFYQSTKKFWVLPIWQESFIFKCVRLLLASLATSLAATLVTAPLVLYYFQQIPVLSMLSNLLASAPIAFLIMPGTFLTYLFAPIPVIGDLAIQVMGWGTILMLKVSTMVAHIPSAIWRAPVAPLLSVNLMLLGLFMLIAVKHRVRLAGVIVIAAGLLLIAFQPQPDFLLMQNRVVLQSDRAKGVLYADGKLGNFEKTLMLQHTGMKQTEDFPCEGEICDFQVKGKAVRLIRSIPALEQACDHPADLILTRYYLDQRCSKTKIVDRRLLRWQGGQAVFIGKTIRVEAVHEERDWHPWVKDQE
jgi:competence protein ComEC